MRCFDSPIHFKDQHLMGISSFSSTQFFRMSSSGITTDVVKACHDELKRMKGIWEQRLSSFIQEKQKSVLSLMRESKYSEEEMRAVRSLWETNYSEETLAQVEADGQHGK